MTTLGVLEQVRDLVTEEITSILSGQRSRKKYNKHIFIDPGHGLYRHAEYGLVYQRPEIEGFREDLLTPLVAYYVAEELEQYGIKVTSSRYLHNIDIDDKSLNGLWKDGTLEYLRFAHIVPGKLEPWGQPKDYLAQDINCRVQYANMIHSDVRPIDLLLSIHFNAGGGYGTETIYHYEDKDSYPIAKLINESTVSGTGARDRGVKAAGIGGVTNYIIVRGSIAPAVIWEGCFIDSEIDRKLFLEDNEYYQVAAQSIVKGIILAIDQGKL